MTCVQDCQREAELEKRISELEAALRLCIDNCIDPTEGEVALTRAHEVLTK